MEKLKDPTLIPKTQYLARRGMLELDLIFQKFLNHCFNKITEQDLLLLHQLLEEPDPHLFNYFFKGDTAPQYSHLIQLIKDCNQNHVPHCCAH